MDESEKEIRSQLEIAHEHRLDAIRKQDFERAAQLQEEETQFSDQLHEMNEAQRGRDPLED
jgi:hypothetical protein